jgi:hypothetical protein
VTVTVGGGAPDSNGALLVEARCRAIAVQEALALQFWESPTVGRPNEKPHASRHRRTDAALSGSR